MKYVFAFYIGMLCGMWALFLVESYQRDQRRKAEEKQLIDTLHHRGWQDSSISIH